MKYSAILFDLDGTLVETIHLWQKAYLEMLNAHGIAMSLEDFMERVYYPNAHYRDVLKAEGLQEDIETFREERDALYCALLREQTQWVDGAQDVLSKARSTSAVGMMTGSWQRYVDSIDEKLSVSPHFQAIVTCDDTQGGNSKPRPYGLELCAERLHVDPKQCIYIGDMHYDITAANAAGMTSCLVWGEHTPVGADENADLVFDSLKDVLTIL